MKNIFQFFIIPVVALILASCGEKATPVEGVAEQDLVLSFDKSVIQATGSDVVTFTIYYKGKKFNGQACGTYFIWYGFGRALIEGLRTDSLMIGPLRVSQMIGIVSVVIGVILFAVLGTKAKENKNEDGEYVPVYDKLEEKSEESAKTEE